MQFVEKIRETWRFLRYGPTRARLVEGQLQAGASKIHAALSWFRCDGVGRGIVVGCQDRAPRN